MPKASVKVMRSYDYCHFEVCLSSDEELTLEEVNNLRKDAARLTDEAVRQYKAARRLDSEWPFKKAEILKEVEIIKEKPASEWTPKEKALVKLVSDKNWEARWDYYDEDDDPWI